MFSHAALRTILQVLQMIRRCFGALHLWKNTGNFGSTTITVRCTCSSVFNFVDYERLAVLECLVTLLGEPFFKFCK
jgi:hypothetical protein